MKRKRKNKKGKPKGSVAGGNEARSSGVIVNLEDDANLDEDGNYENRSESAMEVDTPSSTGTDQHCNLASINPDGSIDRGVGKSMGRVKVKLRTSRTMESQPTSSDAYTQSDTDKSSQQIGLEKQGVVSEKMEDSANSLAEVKIVASGNVSKKVGSIKIKSSKALGSSVNHGIDPVPARSESPYEREPKMSDQDSRYNKEELDTALMIIKKVMKMDAAEPFNVPVNPEALGIPDYFDVIDTPMDFGTICSNLEQGVKYLSSEDVFKDVQYIWDNCYKYNNKGDYILDLMRRVKKNFTKYWTAAGLYSGQPRGTSGVESTQDTVEPSDQGKVHLKGSQLKQKTRKGHGRRHKSDCLCAICVLKRRRREREENARIAKSQHGASDNNLTHELKQEEASLGESPSGENSSSDMDGSLDPNPDAEVEDKGEEVKMGVSKQQYGPSGEKHEEEDDGDEGDEEEDSDTEMKDEGNSEALEKFDKSREEPNRQSQPITAEKVAAGDQTNRNEENVVIQHEEETVADKPKSQESQERHKKVKAYEHLQFENPMLLDLCGTLFPNNSKSIWSGPHSLVQHRSSHTSSIHAAINMLMK
ncbi:PREDICTED: bromodomain-containing [Prunus dulcis]|uniref:PREDICTED: bromodomain-containing n=1 Tax=Prunus dulcis TaxID=3755 RepID=A0A5E4F8K6_PRUDU|nr:bromodomain-containing protein 4-like isoform X1 [Prunus dulcis]XP_034198352.1 bromodomain-containing protein 4-like isoform X1 [Prunus dulcis]XP_034198353.1 bromodomain-containing protein 4-like isoform X1 [Prunus dulcis]XP_034198354.1 bromodomain-containing protein 4-like isoform X1 [Prunus dulcis]XP_034198355.1 bromodomain-containing protein 4-like isoform X1 [Prunus dulcis]KAI5356341.1 hypothetical protein L3X38_009236 [Prunus dulcis]VVA24335.1 PREDICTED: bromodomain-containing [Prunus